MTDPAQRAESVKIVVFSVILILCLLSDPDKGKIVHQKYTNGLISGNGKVFIILNYITKILLELHSYLDFLPIQFYD